MKTTLNLTTVLNKTTAIAREAGQLLREYTAHPNHADTKSASVDLVTAADRASEALIVERLKDQFPDFLIIGEEGGAYENSGDADSYRWYVDPIDGTTNFAHGIPHFAVSMALTTDKNEPIFGVIYDPMRDECFSAVKGLGATLNSKPIHVSKTEKLAQSVVGSGFPYNKWTSPENNAENWGNFVVRSQGIRRLGSAALDMAYVACGRLDGYWEHHLSRWDVFAGIVIVQEAGGKVTDYEGNPNNITIEKPRLVASNGNIHDEIVQVLKLGKDAPRPSN